MGDLLGRAAALDAEPVYGAGDQDVDVPLGDDDGELSAVDPTLACGGPPARAGLWRLVPPIRRDTAEALTGAAGPPRSGRAWRGSAPSRGTQPRSCRLYIPSARPRAQSKRELKAAAPDVAACLLECEKALLPFAAMSCVHRWG